MTPLRTFTLLFLAALLLAAGCVSQESDNQNQTVTKEKYVFLEDNTNYNASTISGFCYGMNAAILGPTYSFNEKTGILDLADYHYRNVPINDSMILFYGDRLGQGSIMYSLPRKISDNLTLDSITEDGTVAFHYNAELIELKPKERWENITRYNGSYQLSEGPSCIQEVTVKVSFYNAGVFDKKKIIMTKRD